MKTTVATNNGGGDDNGGSTTPRRPRRATGSPYRARPISSKTGRATVSVKLPGRGHARDGGNREVR